MLRFVVWIGVMTAWLLLPAVQQNVVVVFDTEKGTIEMEVDRVHAPADATIYGIDGLTWADGSLIGVENGIEPARIVRLTLSADGTRNDRVEILEMNHPKFAEPTIGVVAGQDYYFIANSHGGVLRRAKGPIADEPLTEPAVLRIRLKQELPAKKTR
jgi:hypothetical protein